MSSTTYYQRNRDVMFTKQARDKYHNMSEEKKQKLKEYQKNCREAKKIIRYTGKINNELTCRLLLLLLKQCFIF